MLSPLAPLVALWKSRTVIGAVLVAIGQIVKAVGFPEIGAAFDALGVILAGVGVRSALARTHDAAVTAAVNTGADNPLHGNVPGAPVFHKRGDPL